MWERDQNRDVRKHQQNVQSVPDGSRRYATVPDGTRVAYHQFGYLHPEVEVNMVRGGTRWYLTVRENGRVKSRSGINNRSLKFPGDDKSS